MLKLSKCGGIYIRAIERWHSKTEAENKIWSKFRQHLIVEYEIFLEEGGGKNLGKEGYGMAFNATEATTDESPITE